MIGVDWGTTNFRAFRLHDGAVLDHVASGPSLLTVPPGGFPDALRTAIGPWLRDGEHQILLAGMVGSRQGWVEAPYLPCPANPADLAAAAIAVPFDEATVRLIPGLSSLDPAGVPEVMRGEEVQLAGIVDRIGDSIGDRATVCLPGSHAKWVTMQAGRIQTFTTAMTGEAFAALRGHTILGRLMREGAPHAADAFARGVDRSADPGGLLHHLFGVRTLGLFDRLTPDDAASFLSGLLIGHEIRAAAPTFPVHLVGTATLCALYATAITRCGGSAVTLEEDAAARGLARIGEHVAWT